MTHVIEARGLRMQYGGRTVLDVPDVRLERGRSYALIGPNGSGKTTLLRILAGVLKPTTGSVARRCGSIGYMPQRPYSFGFTVQRNVELAVRGNAPAMAMAALKRVGMEHLAKQPGDRLSGGESQRVALARILAEPKELILLDEPTAAMDMEGIRQVERAILEYAAETGCTMLFTTHLPSQAAGMSEETLLLYNGRLVERGETGRVMAAPESESGRRFLSHWRI